MTTIEKTIRSELPGKDNTRLRAEVRRVVAIERARQRGRR